jgi:hypothetical protein
MEPGPERIPNPQTAGALDKDEERSLKRILGVMRVGKLGATNTQDHRAMALNQRLESRFGELAAAP